MTLFNLSYGLIAIVEKDEKSLFLVEDNIFVNMFGEVYHMSKKV